MIFSLCRLSWVFSGLFISMTIVGCGSSEKVQQEAQIRQDQSHDSQTAFRMGQSAADECYGQKDIDECDNFRQIQDTLSTWCSQNDQNACGIYETLVSYEASLQIRDLID